MENSQQIPSPPDNTEMSFQLLPDNLKIEYLMRDNVKLHNLLREAEMVNCRNESYANPDEIARIQNQDHNRFNHFYSFVRRELKTLQSLARINKAHGLVSCIQESTNAIREKAKECRPDVLSWE